MKTILHAGMWSAAVLLAASAPAPAVEKEDVNKAVDRGVRALRAAQGHDGAWVQANFIVGLTSLSALTLLECDVDANDPAIRLAAKVVRAGAVKETQTYSLALAILFLDRLGDPVDVALIESLTVRLLAGQHRTGDWNYTCPTLPMEEQARLLKQVKESNDLKGRIESPKFNEGKPGEEKPSDNKRLDNAKLLAIVQQVQELARTQPSDAAGPLPDYSNTQFATLGLWVARRHGLPVGGALARVEQRFRTTQNKDGSWPYNVGGESSATMTGAGSLCLAIVDATVNEVGRDKDPKALPVRDIKKDPHLVRGVAVLGALIDDPAAKKRERGLPAQIPKVGDRVYYFLWTLERVCVALDLTTIGTKDWYNWGAEILIANQKEDGNWVGEFKVADTCFALLFLRRANLAKDLTVSLKGKMGDPGQTTLKSGGVGSDSLKGTVIKSPIDAKTEPKGLDVKTEQGKLAKEIVDSAGVKQEQMIEKYRDGKGVTYTEALAAAIPHLTGEAKSKARDALAERLARMKADTLTSYLKDEEAEIRRAAAVACALKESKAHIPQLIEMLRDKEPAVQRGVAAALKDLTRQNFGPAANATDVERDKAIAAWQEWWKKQQK